MEAVADDIGVGQARFVGEDFPVWKKEGRRGAGKGSERGDVLMELLLFAQAVGDDEDWARWKQAREEEREIGLGGDGNGREGQRFPRFHALPQVLRNGN